MTGHKSGDNTRWATDSKTFNRSWKEVQGYLTPSDLDPSTEGKNLLGLTYPGGNNPKKYNGHYDYSYVPKSIAEYPAIGHDRRYDNLRVTGASGLLFDTRAIGADWQFVREELSIAAISPFDSKTRTQAAVLGIGLGLAALGKTLMHQATVAPGTHDYSTLMWYLISNGGVTNAPSK